MGSNSDGQLGLNLSPFTHNGVHTPQGVEELNFHKVVKIRAGSYSAALTMDK